LDAAQGDTISFDQEAFPPTTPVTIDLLSSLPPVTVDELLIDGSDAWVILNGSGLSTGSGLVVNGADGVIIRGLQILGFPWDGIDLIGGATNTIIGGDRSIGLAPLGQGNLISGNAYDGIVVADEGTSGNSVLGNYIGTDATGTAALGNGRMGVFIVDGAKNNIVGGNTANTRNLISGNADIGIRCQGSGADANRIFGNLIGTDASGTAPLGNRKGVLFLSGVKENLIGGDTVTARNLISGNSQGGIQIQNSGTTDNQILGNYIGTDATGTQSLGDQPLGVGIIAGASHNVLGGDIPGAGNLISGNEIHGVEIADEGTFDNRVLGNHIGTDASGTASLGNGGTGILILDGADSNSVGGQGIGSLNLVSGNGTKGIAIQGTGTNGNKVLGNYIGTDVTGELAIGNEEGLVILGGAQENVVGGDVEGARNLISGNTQEGIVIQDTGTSHNQILGNYIGTNATGQGRLGNTEGVMLAGAQDNVVGGTTASARNIISGNSSRGILIQEEGTTGNQVLGNYIGTDVTGTQPLGNGLIGVAIIQGPTDNAVGGELTGAGNIIGGNGGDPCLSQVGYNVTIAGEGTSGNQVLGNYVGTDVAGAQSVGRTFIGIYIAQGARHNTIGGDVSGAGNLISGHGYGIVVVHAGTLDNQLLGNRIGTNIAGDQAVPNELVCSGVILGGAGVSIGSGASDNLVGGATASAGNLISGNLHGIEVYGAGSDRNHILGNRIGTDWSGAIALGNKEVGIVIGMEAKDNVVGGTAAGEANLISGNTGTGINIQDDGTTGNRVLGNYIGTDVTGMVSLGNVVGVGLVHGAKDNVVGSSEMSGRNLVSGNTEVGIGIREMGTTGNQICGNYVGSDVTGNQPLGNGEAGVRIDQGANRNTIGGIDNGEVTCLGNLIAGNGGSGIQLEGAETTSNQIAGNYIGTNISGWAIPNAEAGIHVSDGASLNTIGVANIIAHNGAAGVTLEGETTLYNTVTQNTIRQNGGLPIDWISTSTPTGPLMPPTLTNYSTLDNLLTGNTCAGCRVEVFANPTEEPAGTTFLDDVVADASGDFAVSLDPSDLPSYVAGTVTDLDGTTSEFSAGFEVSTTELDFAIYLPILVRNSG